MNDLFFDEMKKTLEENPSVAVSMADSLREMLGLKTFRTVDEAVKALKQGKFVVGYSYTPTGLAYDNAYRVKGNKFYSYKFIPFTIARPFKMLPSQSVMLPACASGKFVDDFIRDWIDSLHHGFILGDDSLLDLKNLPKFQMDEIADKMS
jgi:hypothetical protein